MSSNFGGIDLLNFVAALTSVLMLLSASCQKKDDAQPSGEVQASSEDQVPVNENAEPVGEIIVEDEEPGIVIPPPADYCDDCNHAPQTIEDVVNILNGMPKPVSLEYFISSITADASIQSSTSTFSAQPATSSLIPRVFLQVNDVLMLSVVPGADTLEIGETVQFGYSKKSDIQFPIEEGEEVDAFEIIYGSGDAANNTCGRVCHRPLRDAQGNPVPFVSTIIEPRGFENLEDGKLFEIAQGCSDDSKACEMFRALFYKGARKNFVFRED